MSIYHWKLGDIALAKVCKKVYAKVRVVKNEEGLFHDEKVLGISAKEDDTIEVTSQLCYYVEISRTKQRLWLPYTSLHLAERSRPFYGSDKGDTPTKPSPETRKIIIEEECTLPLDKKAPKLNPTQSEFNNADDICQHDTQEYQGNNAFKQFVRNGKAQLFDQFYFLLKEVAENQEGVLDYLRTVNASTEDKFEFVIRNKVSEKEIDNYLHQCWQYKMLLKETSEIVCEDDSESSNPSSPSSSPTKDPITLHAPWCLVCGQDGSLLECNNCAASFHLDCRQEWLITIIHRKNPPGKPQKAVLLVEKILSGTRTVCSVQTEKDNADLCPSCTWGPRLGYDDVVWHKLGSCQWWPARVLTPGATPDCLLSRSHTVNHLPLRYYGVLNHSWGDASRMCLFLPNHTAALATDRDPSDLQHAVFDACDDYIAVYLT